MFRRREGFAVSACSRATSMAAGLRVAVVLLGLSAMMSARGEEQAPAVPTPSKVLAGVVKQAIPMNPQRTLWLDRQKKAVYVQSHVVLTAGLLEMLCCPAGTKEHESILASPCPPQLVHAALLALGAETGKPAEFGDSFRPPQGEKLELTLFWENEQGKLQQQDARQWIRTATRRYFVVPLETLPPDLKLPEESDLKYDAQRRELLHYSVLDAAQARQLQQLSVDPPFRRAIDALRDASQPQPLRAEWIFVGSAFQVDPETGKQYYLADGGDFICVANFPSAMIDVAMLSSASDDSRGFEANSDVVPPLGTPVLIKIQRTKDLKPGDKKQSPETNP